VPSKRLSRKGDFVRVTIYLNRKDYDQLVNLAYMLNLSFSAVVRLMLANADALLALAKAQKDKEG